MGRNIDKREPLGLTTEKSEVQQQVAEIVSYGLTTGPKTGEKKRGRPIRPMAEVTFDPIKSKGRTAAPRRRRAGARRTPIREDHAVALLADASRLIGVYCTPETEAGHKALACAAKRIAEGHTLQDLVRACTLASQRWARGDRFAALKSLTYLWGASLPSVLAAGSEASRPMREAPTYRQGEDRAAWAESLAAMPDMPDVAALLGGIQPNEDIKS